MEKELRSELYGNWALQPKAPSVHEQPQRVNGWTVGKNFATPLPPKKK